MGYVSNVAFTFTQDNWNKLCELAKTDKRAMNKRCPFEWMIGGYADVSKEVIGDDGKKYHIVYWNSVKWYDDCYDAIAFLEDEGRRLSHEYMRIGEEYGDIESDESAHDRSDGNRTYFLGRDGDDICISGVTMDSYLKGHFLPAVVKAFVEAAPEAAVKWKHENQGMYGGSDEFEELFEGVV